MLKNSLWIFALVISILPLSQTANAALGRWSGGTPEGGGGYLEHNGIQVNRSSPNILYINTDAGIYKSTDSGTTWNPINNGLSSHRVRNLVIDQESPNTLYAVVLSNSVFRTTDGGNSWALSYSAPAGGYITLIADVPGRANELFITLNDGLYRSNDGGRIFTPVVSLLSTSAVTSLEFDPNDNTKALLGVRGGSSRVYQSADGGLTWNPISSGSDITGTNVADFSFGAGSRVYARDQIGNIWRSNDDGASWALTSIFSPSHNFSVATQHKLFAHPTIADTLYFASRSDSYPNGFAVSTDGGITSVLLNIGLQVNPTLSNYPAVTSFAAHPDFVTNNTFFMLTDGAGFYRSTDAGSTWTAQNSGLTTNLVRALAVHPNPGVSSARIYAGISDSSSPTPALYLSSDGGNSWTTYNSGLGAYSTRAIAIDPTTTATIGTTQLLVSGLESPATAIYRSSDGGANWTHSVGGIPGHIGNVRSITFDPHSCAAPPSMGTCTTGPLQIVYAAAFGKLNYPTMGQHTYRVIKSIDGGANWTPIDGNLPGYSGLERNEFVVPVPIVVNPQDPNTIYIGTDANYSGVTTGLAPVIPSGVFKTVDGGATWSQRSNGLPRVAGSTTTVFDVLSLVMHPTNPDVLWASTVDSYTASSGAIYKTIDGGMNWVRSSTGIMARSDIRTLIVDPADATGNTLYAASGGEAASDPGAIYKTTDGGTTWRSISIGLPSRSAFALALNPNDRNTLYAGTSNGVWRFTQIADSDRDGIADSVESTAPNGGDGNNDSIPDATQAKVGSTGLLSGISSISGISAPTDGCSSGFTSEIISTTCNAAFDVQTLDHTQVGGYELVDAMSTIVYQYPFHMQGFEIPACGEAQVEITYHGAGEAETCPVFDDFRWSFRFYGPQTPGDDKTINWYDFSPRAARLSGNKWRLTLNANQFGSYRPISDSILFVGGPAFNRDRLFRDGFDD